MRIARFVYISALAAFLAASPLPLCGQQTPPSATNNTPALAAPGEAAPNPAVVPEPREGKPKERFETISQRVKEHQGKVDLAFVGDSITQGWEGNGRHVWKKYYDHRQAINLGSSGDQTQHVLWRLDHGNLEGIQPKVCVVMIGTNNSLTNRCTAGQIVEGVTAVVAKLQARLPGVKILLLGIFPRGEDFNELRGKVVQVNQALRHLDDGKQVVFLDIGHRFIEASGRISPEIMPDFLHLSPQGYEVWAEAMEPALARLIGDPPVR